MSRSENIHHVFAAVFEMFQAFRESFKKEHDWIDQAPFRTPKLLAAKQRHIDSLEELAKMFDHIYDHIEANDKTIYKLMACLLFHGVSPHEVNQFVDRKKEHVKKEIDEAIQEGIYQVPEKFQSLISKEKSEAGWLKYLERDILKAEKKPEEKPFIPRYADKPVFSYDQLRSRALVKS